MQLVKNPIVRKRIMRFKSMKRAYYSLWILVVLYGLSLMSELICNSVPLYIKFNHRSYFPVIKFYTEDEFTGNGLKTRPDYKVLKAAKEFSDNSGNYMIFPIFSYGPFEIIHPDSLSANQQVQLKLSPEPVIGTVDIKKDFTIAKALYFDSFSGHQTITPDEDKLYKFFVIPDEIKTAVASRFENKPGPYAQFVIKDRHGNAFEVSLSTYSQRPTPPETIRMTFKEQVAAAGQTIQITFDRNLAPMGNFGGIWKQISSADMQVVLSFVKKRFEHPVDDYRLSINNRQYIASFEKQDIRFPFPPVKEHPLGIDGVGRDVLARILYGLRISLTFGLLLVVCSMAFGVMAGALQGYYGGLLDITAQRSIEIWSALPFLYIMILMGSIYGRSFGLLLFCYGIFNWVGISYYTRAEFLNLRKRPFVEAAKCLGVPSYKIIFKHILPNALVPVITFFPFSLVGAIGQLAALDYLGFGLPPPTPSWGELLFQAQEYRWAWWLILYPSAALFAVMLLGVFIGEGVRNAYDPKQYSRFE